VSFERWTRGGGATATRLERGTEQEDGMPVRQSEAEWKGTLREGAGRMKLGKGGYEGSYSFASRFEDGAGTNPEELLGAAHAGCFSMALAGAITAAGHKPTRVHTVAKVSIEKVGEGFGVTKIELVCDAEVPGLDAAAFAKLADGAKSGCPISKALAATPITLQATLR
jgi:osmotically inducible protein OsmC